jgi:hypothetical protein
MQELLKFDRSVGGSHFMRLHDCGVIFNLKPQPGKPLRWELLTGTSSRIGLPPEITTRRQDACSRGTRLIYCSPISGRTPRSLITMSYLHRREWSTKTSTRLRVRDV